MDCSALDALATVAGQLLSGRPINFEAKEQPSLPDACASKRKQPYDVVSSPPGRPGQIDRVCPWGSCDAPRGDEHSGFHFSSDGHVPLMGMPQRAHPGCSTFVSEPGAAPPVLSALTCGLAMPEVGDAWTLPASKRRSVVSAGGAPTLLQPFPPRFTGSVAALLQPPLMLHPECTPLPRSTPRRVSIMGQEAPLLGSVQRSSWDSTRASPAGSAASDGPFSSAGGGGGSVAGVVRQRSSAASPAYPEPMADSSVFAATLDACSARAQPACTDNSSQPELEEDPAACLCRIGQSPSKGGPDMLEKMRLAQVLLTHRNALGPDQVQQVIRHLATLCQSASVEDLVARRAGAQHETQRLAQPGQAAGACRMTPTEASTPSANTSPRPAVASAAALDACGLGCGRQDGCPRGSTSSSSSSRTRGEAHATFSTLSGPPQGPATTRTPGSRTLQASCRTAAREDATHGLRRTSSIGEQRSPPYTHSMECNDAPGLPCANGLQQQLLPVRPSGQHLPQPHPGLLELQQQRAAHAQARAWRFSQRCGHMDTLDLAVGGHSAAAGALIAALAQRPGGGRGQARLAMPRLSFDGQVLVQPRPGAAATAAAASCPSLLPLQHTLRWAAAPFANPCPASAKPAFGSPFMSQREGMDTWPVQPLPQGAREPAAAVCADRLGTFAAPLDGFVRVHISDQQRGARAAMLEARDRHCQ